MKYFSYGQNDGYSYGQVHLFWPHGWKDRCFSLPGPSPPSVPAYHAVPSAGSVGDQLLTTEFRSPRLAISDKTVRAKGPIMYEDNSLFGILNHNLPLLPLGLSYSQVSGITSEQICWVRCISTGGMGMSD